MSDRRCLKKQELLILFQNKHAEEIFLYLTLHKYVQYSIYLLHLLKSIINFYIGNLFYVLHILLLNCF